MTERVLTFEEFNEYALKFLLITLQNRSLNQYLLSDGLAETFFEIRQFCVTEFYRQYFTVETSELLAVPNHLKAVVEKEVVLWIKVYQLIQEVFRYHTGGFECPAIWFGAIIHERKLVLFRALNNGEKLDKGGLLEKIRIKNMKLLTLEGNPSDMQTANAPLEDNPDSIAFDPQTEPHTWQLISDAMSLVEQENGFRQKFYTPMVKARQSLTSDIASPGTDLLVPSEDGKGAVKKNKGGRPPKKKRGRPPKKKSSR